MVGEKDPKSLSTVFLERELCVLCKRDGVGEGAEQREGGERSPVRRDSTDDKVGARGAGAATEQLCLRCI